VSSIGEINSLLSGAGIIPYGSQQDTGKRIVLTENDLQGPQAAQFVNTTIGQVYGGIFQVVVVDTAATASNVAVGKAAFLLDTQAGGGANSGALNYVVTDEAHAASTSHICGVFLNSITPGNFGVIQVHGKANVLYDNVLTSTLVAGSSVILKGGGLGTWDITIATALTTANIGLYIGHPLEAGAINTLKRAYLRGIFGRY